VGHGETRSAHDISIRTLNGKNKYERLKHISDANNLREFERGSSSLDLLVMGMKTQKIFNLIISARDLKSCMFHAYLLHNKK
jgi:hypothetical protein